MIFRNRRKDPDFRVVDLRAELSFRSLGLDIKITILMRTLDNFEL